MPGTGDVIYVLGPSLVALVLGIVILVTMRALRRGPAISSRSAPDHGLDSATRASDADDRAPRIPAQRRPGIRVTATRTVDGQHLVVRPSDTEHDRAADRTPGRP